MGKELFENRTNQPKYIEHIIGLDALRTLAIIGVTLFHIFPEQIQGGFLGVSLFFVLTGFLLAYTSKRRWEAGSYSLLEYYKKRFLRIYPELCLVIFVSIGVLKLLTPQAVDGLRNELISIFLGYNNWWQIAQNADYFSRIMNMSPFTHLWFLGIELQYYLVWPLLFWLYNGLCKGYGPKAGITMMLLLALAAAMVMPLMYIPDMDVTRLYYGTDTRIYAFLFGAIMGLTFTAPNIADNMIFQQNDKLKTAVLLFLLTVTCYAAATLDGQCSFTYQGGMLGMTLVFCAMLYLVTHSSNNISAILEHPLMVWLGKYSYGIFLWQYPVIYVFQQRSWTDVQYYQAAEILIILVLSWLSSFVVTCILQKMNFLHGQQKYTIRTILAGTICSLSLCFGCYGFCSLATASADTKSIIQTELKEQLAEQTQNLSEHQETTAKPNICSETQHKDVNSQLTGINCVGDSIMLGASGEITRLFPNVHIDAKVSRYVGDGVPIFRKMVQAKTLGDVVVVHLGTNGPICGASRYEKKTQELLQILGDRRTIFWINYYIPGRRWEASNNAYLSKLAATHKNIIIVDWYGLISKHKEWLSKDHVHPNRNGCRQYAKLLRDTMVKTLTVRNAQIHAQQQN